MDLDRAMDPAVAALVELVHLVVVTKSTGLSAYVVCALLVDDLES